MQIGHGALTEHDRLRNARQTVALARAGLTLTQGTATPLLVTQLRVAEGRGHALLGDVNTTRRAMREAERHYERSHPGEELPWLTFYTDDSLAADLGRCLRDTGEPGHAAKLITQAVTGVEPWQDRGRAFFQTDLASAHLAGRDLERAAAAGRATSSPAPPAANSRTTTSDSGPEGAKSQLVLSLPDLSCPLSPLQHLPQPHRTIL